MAVEFDKMKENTVKAENQVSTYTVLINENGKGQRILFLGNSITRHEPNEDIGWSYNHGMSASKPENDYVHRVIASLPDDNAYCTCQVFEWEYNHYFQNEFSRFEEARDFGADIIVARFVENCQKRNYDPVEFERGYRALLDYYNPSGKAKIVYSSGFWKHPADPIIEKIAKENGMPYVFLGDLGEKDEMKALGLFWHSGVAVHPGDAGMAEIANRIIKAISNLQ